MAMQVHSETAPEKRQETMTPDGFIKRCDALASRLGVTRSTLSTKLFKDGKALDRIAGGGDVGARRLERAVVDMSRLEDEAGRADIASARGSSEARP